MYKKALTLCVAIALAAGLGSCGHKSSDNGQQTETTEVTNSESNGNQDEGDEDVIRVEDSDYSN